MNRKLIIGIVVVVVIVIALIGAKKAGYIGGEQGIEVTITTAEKATIVETVIASGKIQPEVEVKLSSEVSGEIIELPIEEGQEVQKGDLLVRINPDIFLAAVNRAKASVNSASADFKSAEAQLVEAERNYNRNKALSAKKVISAAEFDAIQRAYDVAKLNKEGAGFRLVSSKATLKEAQDNLARTTIYAPQSGTISMLSAEVGERVVGTAQMSGTEILRLANLEAMEVLVEVNENDIIRVETGDTANIEVDAYLDETFKGIVTEIANSAKLSGTSTDQVTNFEVKVRMLKSSYEKLIKGDEKSPFRPGMTASLEIVTQKLKDVLTVPIEAVTTRNDTVSGKNKRTKAGEEEKEDFEVVFLISDGKSKLQVVKTGIQDDERIQVISGLEDGDKLVKGPYSVVSKSLKNDDKLKLEEDKKSRKKKEEKEEE